MKIRFGRYFVVWLIICLVVILMSLVVINCNYIFSVQSFCQTTTLDQRISYLSIIVSAIAMITFVTTLVIQYSGIIESQNQSREMNGSQAAVARLNAATVLLEHTDRLLDKFQDAQKGGDSVGDMLWEEQRLLNEKYRLLLEVCLVVVKRLSLGDDKELWDKIDEIEKRRSKLGGGDRPLAQTD